MKTIQVEAHLEDKCHICKEPLFVKDAEGNVIKSVTMKDDSIGLSHDRCFLPLLDESFLAVLLQIRCYSIGDTISITPIVREFKRLYPKAKLCVMTFFPDIFIYNPYVDEIIDMNRIAYQDMISKYVYHLDAFNSEKGGHYAMHSVDFAAISTFSRQIQRKDCGYEVPYSDLEISNVLNVFKELNIDPINDKLIVVNPHGTEWKTRDWGRDNFPELIKKLRAKYPSYKIASIGGKRAEVPSKSMNNYVQVDCDFELYGKFSILDSIAFFNMECVKLIITPDTGTLHIAACAQEVPIIGVFTLIRSEFRTPIRNGEFGYKFIGINADNPCCCSYNARFLTDSMHFGNCPKVDQLNRLKELNIPNKLRMSALNNYDKSLGLKEHEVIKEIDEELKTFSPLRCFPSVDKVMNAVATFLKE